MTSLALLPILELVASLAYVGSKYLLSRQKKTGWIVGMIAALLTGIAFVGYARYIIVLQEVGNIFLYGYGYSHWGDDSQKVGNFRAIVLLLVVALSLLLVAVSFSSSGAVQAVVNTLYVMGTVGLIFQIRWGWAAYVVVHLGMAYISWVSGAYVFLIFQLVSTSIAFVALTRKK